MGIGVIALGIFVGWIARYFLIRLGAHTIGVMSALLSVVLGGVVMNLFVGGMMDDLFWFYPIGLAIGFAIGYFADGFRRR